MQSVVKTNTPVWYFDLIPRRMAWVWDYMMLNIYNMCYCIVLQSPQQHILDLTLDPLGQWLACACLDGAVCLIPVMALMLVNTCPILTSLDHCFHSERITQIRTRLKPVVACVGIMVRETVYVILYHIVGNFQGRKRLRISRFYGYLWKFSLWNFGAWHLLVAPASNLRKCSPWKSFFHQFAKVFSHKSFLLYGSTCNTVKYIHTDTKIWIC